jgi:uncharacterized protein YkwD
MKLTSKLWLPVIACYTGLCLIPLPVSAGKLSRARSIGKLSSLERGVLVEMNRVRSNPRNYVKSLRNWRSKFQGKQAKLSENRFLQTQEGVAAVDEAIRALSVTRPAPALRLSVGMSLAARDHVIYQGARGLTGHAGQHGSTPFSRMDRYGRWLHVAGENISYGAGSAAEVVRDLIVDDGVPNRSHRIAMFKPEYRVTGIACGYHRQYRTMCVIGYAAGYQEKH